MARKFLTAIDLAKGELQNAAIQSLASAPGTPVKFQLYGNTSDNTLYWWDGSQWIAAKAAAGATPAATVTTQAVGDAPVVGVSTNFAREDHKHGREAFGTITAQTAFGAASGNGAAVTLARSDHTHGTPTHDNAAHSAINLSALAVPTAAVNMNGQLVTNVGTPVSGTDATNKTYVDNLLAGLSWKESVRVASTANVALTGLTALDGVTPAANDRILLKNQTTTAENGIWLAQSGAWTRATDADSSGELDGMAVFVMEGTANADTAWVLTTNAPITVGTTGLTYVQFAGGGSVTAGAGMTQSGNTLNVIAGDTSLTVAADDVRVNTSVIATVASLAGYVPTTRNLSVGTGITGGGTLASDRSFALDTTYTDGRYATVANGAKRFAAAVAAATSTAITHNFGTRDVIVDVYRVAAPYDTVEADVERTDTNNVTVRFNTAPAAGEYRVVVMA